MSTQTLDVREKLAQLEEGLKAAVPNIATLLRDIHRNLKSDPDIVTLLSDEECSVLVRGLKKQTSTSIATTASKAKPKKALSKMTLADL